jgi:tripartite-type tricarboxylate transporter receptor subunit TctC
LQGRAGLARIARALAVVLVLDLGATAVAQESVKDSVEFRGKTVTVVASFEAGGPYDFYSRLIARHLGAHLPGHPAVVVQNMPGAGGLRGANYLYNVAARDGTVLGVVSQTVAVGQVLATTGGIQYDARRYSWIGRINANVEVLHTWHASGVRSIEDARRREVVVAGTGPTSSSVVMPRLMNELIGTKFKVVTGFAGPTSAQLALERGEVDGIVKPWSSIKVGSADWLREGKINLIVQYALARHPDLARVPAVVDLAGDEAQRAILGLYASGSDIGRSIVAPPGVPAATVGVLRDAFWETMRDTRFLDEVAKGGVDIVPLAGDRLQDLVGRLVDVSPQIVATAKTFSAPRR